MKCVFTLSHFGHVWLKSFQKLLNKSPNFIWRKFCRDVEKAEFYAELKSFEKVKKGQKSYKHKLLRTVIKVRKLYFSLTFLSTFFFFWVIFCTSNQIKSNHVYCETDDPIHIIIHAVLSNIAVMEPPFHPQTRQLA
jgi:hypothetical protein